MYIFDEANKLLINQFSEMKTIYEQNEDYYEDISYVFYESEFVKFIVRCANSNKYEKLIKIFDFIEELLKNGDIKLVNLIEVAVVESVYFEKNFSDKKMIEAYFGSLTQESYRKCF